MVRGAAYFSAPKTHSRGRGRVFARVANLLDPPVPLSDISLRWRESLREGRLEIERGLQRERARERGAKERERKIEGRD